MRNLHVTGNDQIIDLDCVAAIEVIDGVEGCTLLNFHLITGITISVQCKDLESASSEKWAAFQQMKAGGKISLSKQNP